MCVTYSFYHSFLSNFPELWLAKTPVSGRGSGIPIRSCVFLYSFSFLPHGLTAQLRGHHLKGYIVEHHDFLYGSCLFDTKHFLVAEIFAKQFDKYIFFFKTCLFCLFCWIYSKLLVNISASMHNTEIILYSNQTLASYHSKDENLLCSFFMSREIKQTNIRKLF